MCNWESWEQLEAKYYIRLCIPGSDLVWPCWIIAALRVCVSKFTHDWHEFLVQINDIKCRPHRWLLWSDTWHYSWQPSCQWWFLWSRYGKDSGTTDVIHRPGVTICVMETFQGLASSLIKSLCLYDLVHLGTRITMFVLREAYGGSGDTFKFSWNKCC